MEKSFLIFLSVSLCLCGLTTTFAKIQLLSIEAFILVGGRSARLGRDKALEQLGGKTFAERALTAVQDSGVAEKITFVAGSRIAFAIEAERIDTPFVFDTIEGRGPVGGLHTALTNSAAEWAFILACDLPFVTAELIRRLAAYTHGEPGDIGAVVPEQPDGRLQPLCGFYRVAAARPIVEDIIARPRPSPSMLSIVELLDARIVTPAEYRSPGLPANVSYFSNINTEEDLTDARELERKLSGRSEI